MPVGFISSGRSTLALTHGDKSIKRANHLVASSSVSAPIFRLVSPRGSLCCLCHLRASQLFSWSSRRTFRGFSLSHVPHERLSQRLTTRSSERRTTVRFTFEML